MRFSREQRNLVVHAVVEAEEHTARYYCIPPFRWQQLRYDLLTCEDREWEPLPELVLARVQLLEELRPKREAPLDFYRIQLNDPSILLATRREKIESHFYDFLVYILTHEMVHLVRLSSIIDQSKEALPASETEEKRVQRIARQILSNTGHWGFRPILERFCVSHLISS